MMKRANHEGSIRQRPDGRWEARYTVGRDPGTGRQVQRSIYGSTQDEVRKALRQATASVDDGSYMKPSTMTVGQWLETWHSEYIGSVKPATVTSYAQHIRNHLKPAIGAVKLRALNGTQIQKLYNDMGKEGLNPKTVKNVLQKALAQAVKLGYLRANPCDACTLPRVERKPIKPLDSPEMAAFLKQISGHRLEALFKVDIFTGMRMGEILGLQWSCVDFERGTITIDKQLQRERKPGGKWYFGTLKNDKTRVITPAPFVLQTLKEQKRRQTVDRLRVGTLWDAGEFPGLVFTTETGSHLDGRSIWRQFKTQIEKIGLPETRFHDLRHTYAVSSLRAGDDVKTVQENLGHHTAAFTLDQYGHVTETMKRDSAKRMEAFIKALNTP